MFFHSVIEVVFEFFSQSNCLSKAEVNFILKICEFFVIWVYKTAPKVEISEGQNFNSLI